MVVISTLVVVYTKVVGEGEAGLADAVSIGAGGACWENSLIKTKIFNTNYF